NWSFAGLSAVESLRMARVFRAMMVEHGMPKTGPTHRCLGVAPVDVLVAPDGTVSPDARHGMSVAPTWRELPTHRIPARLRDRGAPDATGKNADACWRMGEGPFVTGPLTARLRLCVTSRHHGVVQPSGQMALARYEALLAATQPSWVIDET